MISLDFTLTPSVVEYSDQPVDELSTCQGTIVRTLGTLGPLRGARHSDAQMIRCHISYPNYGADFTVGRSDVQSWHGICQNISETNPYPR